MNTSLVISGYALYIFMFFFAVLALGFIFYGCAYVKEARERDKTERKYRKLRSNYNKLFGMYNRAVLKVPDIKLSINEMPQFISERDHV